MTTLARAAQGLAITTKELTVVGFIFCSLATSICWWYKPNDVEFGHVFELSTSIDDILKQAGEEASQVYRNTPLDFASREEWTLGNLWIYYVNILRPVRSFPRHTQGSTYPKAIVVQFPKATVTDVGTSRALSRTSVCRNFIWRMEILFSK